MPSIKGERWMPVDAKTAWQVLSDLDGYGRFTDGIQTRLLRGTKQTAVRECRDDRGTWTEDVVDWQDGHRYTVAVDTTAEHYPFPVRTMQGTWYVRPEGDGTVVGVRFMIKPRGIRGWIWLLREARRGGDPVKDLLDAYQEELAPLDRG